MNAEVDAIVGQRFNEYQKLQKELEELKKKLEKQGKLYKELGEKLEWDPLKIGYSGIELSGPTEFIPLFDFDSLDSSQQIKEKLKEYRQKKFRETKLTRELGL